ncbi:hypothetical protein ACFUC1_02515 [Pedococcus sp. NPDC057267]|uniref:hypothetical protein n=1 Tax=Pedococcus sp. NPDC057267 TaxID=3346077 RepID=UPI00362EC91D
MSRHQTDEAARRRLLAAQRAESQALRVVMTVARRKEALQERVNAVDIELAEAQATLTSISGVGRAASLLELDERELRQRVKRADAATEPRNPGIGTARNSPPET